VFRPAPAAAVAVASSLLAALAGCSDASSPTGATPNARTAAVAGAARSSALAVIPPTRYFLMRDDCEPTSFNAMFGAGICSGRGRTTATAFLAELARTKVARAWVFVPPATVIARGTRVIASNIGGEDHTFTPVRAFGGGIIPVLNDLSGTPTVAPECEHLEADDFVRPNRAYTVEREALARDGTVRVQCCIHPWMRATIIVGGSR
jgi:hypothetical protein